MGGEVMSKVQAGAVARVVLFAVCAVGAISTWANGAAAAPRSASLIRSFSLVDGRSGREIPGFSPLRDGSAIAPALLEQRPVNLRANVSSRVAGVRFTFGDGRRRTDRRAPYLVRARPVAGKVVEVTAEALSRRDRRRVLARRKVTLALRPDGKVTPVTGGEEPVDPGTGGGDSTGKPGLELPPIPGLAAWREHMESYGRRLCDAANIAALSTWEGNVWYYDGARVYFQIGDYLKDPSWYECARYSRDVYRPFVLGNNGSIGAWRVFPHGLAEDFLRTGDESSREAALQLARNSPFIRTGGDPDPELSRETAYVINALLVAEDLGAGRDPRLATAVNNALGHLEAWTVRESTQYVKPFMVGLTFEALIDYAGRTGDRRILPAIERAADWLWENGWVSAERKYPYIICRPGASNQECLEDHTSEGVDLNLLVAPAYAWLYRQTGAIRHRERGDRLFEGGVAGAWLNQGKQFSQNYRWSFDFVRWRSK